MMNDHVLTAIMNTLMTRHILAAGAYAISQVRICGSLKAEKTSTRKKRRIASGNKSILSNFDINNAKYSL